MLKYFYGVMGSGKTKKIMEIYSKINKIIIAKPLIDTKGDNKIISRTGESLTCNFLIDKNTNITNKVLEYIYNDIENNYTLIIDEAQFLTIPQVEELASITDNLNVDVICLGLIKNYKGEMFKTSQRLFELADSSYELSKTCDCGLPATFNPRFLNDNLDLEGDLIQIDGTSNYSYKSMCRKCLKKVMKK